MVDSGPQYVITAHDDQEDVRLISRSWKMRCRRAVLLVKVIIGLRNLSPSLGEVENVLKFYHEAVVFAKVPFELLINMNFDKLCPMVYRRLSNRLTV